MFVVGLCPLYYLMDLNSNLLRYDTYYDGAGRASSIYSSVSFVVGFNTNVVTMVVLFTIGLLGTDCLGTLLVLSEVSI